MRICIVNPFYDNAPSTFLEVTGRYRHVEALAAALARRGHDVAVVQAFFENKIEQRGDVQFRYAATPWRSVARLSGGRIGLDLLLRGNLKNLIAALADFKPDAVHMNGITLLQPLVAIGEWCARNRTRMTVSYHGGTPRSLLWLRGIQQRALSRCNGAFFPSAIQARLWVNGGLLRGNQVVECMEVSSTFSPADRVSARIRTGLQGDPVFVWNGGLHKRKDPLTALETFRLVRASWHDARLYMIYLSAEMLLDVERAIVTDTRLRGAVKLLGLVPYDSVQDILNSADFFIQTSLSEIGSYSLLEAMSCGLVPVLTDIPLFRRVTNDGRLGVLAPVGQPHMAAELVLKLGPSEIRRISDDVRSFFLEALSYDAIARTYEVECQKQEII